MSRRFDLEPVGREIGSACLEELINSHSQAEIRSALLKCLNTIGPFGPEYRRDVVVGFAVALTPIIEAGIAAIRERK